MDDLKVCTISISKSQFPELVNALRSLRTTGAIKTAGTARN